MNSNKLGIEASVYSPLWYCSDKELPRDRVSINMWCRSFYALDQDVNRIINQHSILPLKYFKISKIEDNTINQYYKNVIKTLNIPNILELIIREYLIIGEVFIFLDLDLSKGTWIDLKIQNPDYMIVKKDLVSNFSYYLRPDENLRRSVFSKNKEDEEIISKLNTFMIDSIRKGENISISDYYLTYFANKLSPYEIRGTSQLISLLSILNKPFKTDNEIDTIKKVLVDFELCKTDDLYKNIIYTNYSKIFSMLENWFENKLFSPIAQIQGFYENNSKSEKQLLIPKVKFDRDELKRDIGMV